MLSIPGSNSSGIKPGALHPAVHRVASLAKRWLLGTHQGSVDETHLQSYLDEFVFRFNRRRSRSRGMVFYRVLSSSPSCTHRCAIATWSPTRNRSGRRPRRQDDGVIPRPWTGHGRLSHGERPDPHESGQMSTPVDI
jgi:hypothetical protein